MKSCILDAPLIALNFIAKSCFMSFFLFQHIAQHAYMRVSLYTKRKNKIKVFLRVMWEDEIVVMVCLVGGCALIVASPTFMSRLDLWINETCLYNILDRVSNNTLLFWLHHTCVLDRVFLLFFVCVFFLCTPFR